MIPVAHRAFLRRITGGGGAVAPPEEEDDGFCSSSLFSPASAFPYTGGASILGKKKLGTKIRLVGIGLLYVSHYTFSIGLSF